MKLYVIEKGDLSVGIFDQIYELDVPFNREDLTQQEIEEFRESVEKLYQEYTSQKVYSEFDFEIK